MMGIIVSICIIIACLFVITKDVFHSIICIFLSLFLFDFIIEKLSPVIAGSFGTIITFFCIYAFIIHFKIVNNSRLALFLLKRLLTFIIVFIVFIAILAYAHSNNLIDYLLFFRNFFRFYFVMLLLVAYVDSVNDIDGIMRINVFINIFIAFQVLLACVQFILPSSFAHFFVITSAFSQSTGEIVDTVKFDLEDKFLIVGTLQNITVFADVMAVFMTFLLYNITSNKFRYKGDILVFFLGVFFVLYSGIRTGLISMLVGLVLVLFYYSKKYLLYSLIVFSILIALYSVELKHQSELARIENVGFDNPLLRNLALISYIQEFIEKGVDGDIKTASRTVNLIHYFKSDILWGIGKDRKSVV